jgi:hypothetical protein
MLVLRLMIFGNYKLLNKDKKQLAFAPSSLILTNYFLPVNRALCLPIGKVCMEYKVQLSLTIYNSDKTKWASGYKYINLPFAPFIGLEFREHRTGYTPPINRVVYFSEDNSFHCYLEQFERVVDGTILDLDFYIKIAKRNGWLDIDQIFES